jgi:hypothetical protein
MTEFLGLTTDQLLTLISLGVILLVALLILKTVVKLTKAFLRLGCLGILVILVVLFFVLRG